MSILEHRYLITSLITLLEAISRGGITGSKGRQVYKSHDIYLSQMFSRNVANLSSITLLPTQEGMPLYLTPKL